MIWTAFLINPFLTLLYAFRHFRAPSTKNIIWAFTVFFAMTIAIGTESTGSDINRYMGEVENLHRVYFDYPTAIEYFKNSGEIDVLRTVLAIGISRFTGNGYVLVVIYGIIFGYFFSRNMWFVIHKTRGKIQWLVLFLIIALFLVMPIWTLGGFRFNTATHVFIYGLLPYLFERKFKSLIWCFITPVVFHFSFLVPLSVLLVYLLFGNRLKLYYVYFIFGVFIAEINIKQFNDFLEANAPVILLDRTSNYRNEEVVERIRTIPSQKTWHARFYGKGLHYPIIAFLLLLFFRSGKLVRNDKRLLKVLAFTYLFYGTASIMSTLPSGGRFLAPAGLLALSLMILYLQNYRKDLIMQRVMKAMVPFIVLFIIVSIRDGFYLFSTTTIFGNPLMAFFSMGDNHSLNDFLIQFR